MAAGCKFCKSLVSILLSIILLAQGQFNTITLYVLGEIETKKVLEDCEEQTEEQQTSSETQRRSSSLKWGNWCDPHKSTHCPLFCHEHVHIDFFRDGDQKQANGGQLTNVSPREGIRWEAHRACKNKLQVSESLKIYWPFTAKQTNLYQRRRHWLQIIGSQDFSSCRCATWENLHKHAAFFLGVLLWFLVKIIILCLWHCNNFYYNQVFCPKEDYCFCLESVRTFRATKEPVP